MLLTRVNARHNFPARVIVVYKVGNCFMGAMNFFLRQMYSAPSPYFCGGQSTGACPWASTVGGPRNGNLSRKVWCMTLVSHFGGFGDLGMVWRIYWTSYVLYYTPTLNRYHLTCTQGLVAFSLSSPSNYRIAVPLRPVGKG